MIISRGAEAIISLEDGKIVKERIKKGYRIPEIDDYLRKTRTSSEAKIMKRCLENGIPVPKVFKVENYKIFMEYIEGKKLAEDFSIDMIKKLGGMVAKMHNIGVIHGDLTTANVLRKGNDLYIIDFGLSKISNKAEDKAMDLYTFKEALKANHTSVYENAFNTFMEEYKNVAMDINNILKQYNEIEKRRRYYESSNY